VPEPLRGRLSVHLRVAHVGPGGAEVVAPMRAVAPALIDAVGELPYTSIDAVHQDPEHPLPAHERVELMPALTAEAVDRILDLAGPSAQTPVLLVELRQMGGALAREPRHPNAVTGRDAAFSLFVLGVLAPGIEAIVPPAVDATADAMRPFTSGHTLVNQHGRPGDAADRARAWTPQTYARLLAVKRTYDPANVFRYGHALLG
jgi:FAD/FMN-containing dehydrogenase